MAERVDDFIKFLQAMRGKRLLHLGHKHADCDALGSAYVMSRILTGHVGFANGVKNSALDLANSLGIKWVADPNPSDYEYTILYDTYLPSLLGIPLPAHFALFDHHEPGGHRYADISSELVDFAEWAFVQPVESTCSLLIDLFQTHSITIDQKMAITLAAGIVTDTLWLRHADASALRRLALVLEEGNLFFEDILSIVNSSERRATYRSEVLAAIRNMNEYMEGEWSILATTTQSQDLGFAVMDALHQLGGDVSVVGFPHGDFAMVMAQCVSSAVEEGKLNLNTSMKEVANLVQAEEAWGTAALGRIIASSSPQQLLAICVSVIKSTLSKRNPGL